MMRTHGRSRLGKARRHVMSLMWPSLEPLGFRHHGTFHIPVTKHTTGLVCVGIGAVDPIEASFTIGVRFDQIDNLISRLLDMPPSGVWTVGARLCDLVPSTGMRRSTIRIFGEEADQAALSQVVNHVKTFGIPFMRHWSDLTKLIDHMKQLLMLDAALDPWIPDPATTLPAALALTGDWKYGRAIVQETVASLPLLKNRGYALTYAKFAKAYEELAASGLPKA